MLKVLQAQFRVVVTLSCHIQQTASPPIKQRDVKCDVSSPPHSLLPFALQQRLCSILVHGCHLLKHWCKLFFGQPAMDAWIWIHLLNLGLISYLRSPKMVMKSLVITSFPSPFGGKAFISSSPQNLNSTTIVFCTNLAYQRVCSLLLWAF